VVGVSCGMPSRVARAAALAPVLVGLLVVTLLTGGCRANPVDPGPVSSPTVAPVSGPVAFHVQLGAGQSLTTRSPQANDCPGFSADVSLGGDARVTLAAFATRCPIGTGNSNLGNGRHGVYRTSADIPAGSSAGARTVHTALGDATVFTQPYYECTNSCKNYTEPVAVLTLTQPQDSTVQALTVYSAKGTIDLDKLVAFLTDQLLA
jgi:hypothetical protein